MATRSVNPAALFAVLLLFLSACAGSTHYIPQSAEGITLSEDRATASNELVNVTVDHTRADAYSRAGDDRLIIFRVGIRNLSANPISLSTDQFILIDDAGQQYSAVPPQLLAGTQGFDCYPRFGAGIGWWGWDGARYWDPGSRNWGPGGRYWGPGHPSWGGMGYSGNEYYCDSRWSQEVLSESLLPSAPIQPNARVKGVVFFRGRSEDAGPLRMEIHLPNSKPLRFPFRPEPKDD